ncbi:DUF1015 domain-containing protein [Flavobacterium sp.]|uniref:DUF1015 domain-containing protein n=1 Tax=Flavobacterium sp. TaxID=239 RepID=UPI003527ADF4
MAKIIPIKAVRPAEDKVALVTCRNYDDYSQAELAAWLNFNPYSFLHVIHPAYIHSQKISWDKRFKGVAHKYHDFKNDGIFVEEEKPVFYLYEIQSKTESYTGILAGTSVDEYNENKIKKHEDTLQYRVDLFKEYLQQTQFNTEPVLITYPDSVEMNTWITLKKKSKPLYSFSTTTKQKHTLWKIDTESEMDWLEEHFATIPNLYIADGHHRSASAALLHKENKTPNKENLNYFLSFLISESTVKIYEFNRVIRDLNQFDTTSFMEALTSIFNVVCKHQELWKPTEKGEFGMYIDGKFYALFLRKKPNSSEILENLDAQILYNQVLNPLLGIGDLRNDERIDYISGKQPITTIKELVDEGEFAVGFMLYPIDISEIKTIADADLIMPPKSTYIEPKFRSGLVVYEL